MHGLFYISTFDNPFRLTVSDIDRYKNNKGESWEQGERDPVSIKFYFSWTTDKTVSVPVEIQYRRKRVGQELEEWTLHEIGKPIYLSQINDYVEFRAKPINGDTPIFSVNQKNYLTFASAIERCCWEVIGISEIFNHF